MLISVILLVCFSLMVNGTVNYQNQFVNDSLLTFFQDSNRFAYVNLSGNAYVINSNLTLTGVLSDWETVYSFTNLNTPKDAEFINNNKWLITDTNYNRIILVNPSNNNITFNYNLQIDAPQDADYISSSNSLLITNTGKDTIILLDNISGNPYIKSSYTYNITDPEFYDADYITEDIWLVTDGASKKILLVNVLNDSIISSYTSSNSVYDAELISDDRWVIARRDGVIDINITNSSILNSYSSNYDVLDVDIVGNNEKWLVTTSGLVSLINVSNNAVLNNYTSSGVFSFEDADYISDTEWLVTDKTGTKKVSFQKQYYPNNLTLDVGDDGSIEWSYPNDLNTTDITYNLTSSLNDYLNLNCLFGSDCDIPFKFHSDNSGKLNLSDLNVLYDYIPTVEVISPNGGENWSGMQTVQWNVTDDDNDNLSMEVYYWYDGWIWLNSTSGTPNVYNYIWNTSEVSDNRSYTIMVNVSDGMAPVVNDTSNGVFTIDNTFPTISVTYPNGGELLNGWINITWTATDNFDTALDISIEGSTDNGTTWGSINISTENDGIYHEDVSHINTASALIRINATDDAGNMKSDVSDNVFTVDNTPPNVTLLSPADNHDETNNSTVVFSFNATDNINASFTCDLYIDNSLDQNKTVASGVADSFTKNLGEGSFTWAIRCFDGINYGWSANRTLTVDTMILTPSFLPTGTISSSSATLTVVNGESVTLNNATFDNNTISMTAQGINFTYSATGLATGTYELIVNLTDNFGHNDVFSHNYSVSIFTGNNVGGGGSSNNRGLPRGADSGFTQCNDGIDNDGDGLIDLDDPECEDINDDSESKSTCVVKWECSEWGECVDNKQTRECKDVNGCGVDYFKPEESQACISVAPEETFEVESTLPPGVGQAISLFDRIKANWWVVLLSVAVVAGLAVYGWRKRLFGGKGFEPPFVEK